MANEPRKLPPTPTPEPPKKSKALTVVRWLISIGLILDGFMLTIFSNVLFITMLALGLIINPKFNDLYTKVTKREPLDKKTHIVAGVVCTLLMYVSLGIYGTLQKDDVPTAEAEQEVFTTIVTKVTEPTVTTTEETTVTTTEATTVTTTEEVTTTTEEVTTTEETVTEPEAEATVEYTPELICASLKVMASTYFDDVDVIYDSTSDTYIFKISQSGITVAMYQAKSDDEARQSWDYMVDSMCTMCQNYYDEVQKLDSGANVSVWLLNDLNTENVLVTVLNGVVLADAIDTI